MILAIISLPLFDSCINLTEVIKNYIYRYYGQFIPEGNEDNEGNEGYILVRSTVIGLLTSGYSFRYIPINLFIYIVKPLDRLILNWAIKNRDFDKLIMRAVRLNKYIQVSLSTGKIYVGHVIRGIDPEQERTELRLLPVLSGYRTEKGIVDFTGLFNFKVSKETNDSIRKEFG